MKHTPMTDEEIENAKLIPAGTRCQAEVKSAEDHISAKGKESIKLIFTVYNGDQRKEIWCFITPAYAKLYKHAIVAMVSQEQYEAGEISPDLFENKSCEVEIGTQEYEDKEGNKRNKNVIADIFRMEGTISSKDDSKDLPF